MLAPPLAEKGPKLKLIPWLTGLAIQLPRKNEVQPLLLPFLQQHYFKPDTCATRCAEELCPAAQPRCAYLHPRPGWGISASPSSSPQHLPVDPALQVGHGAKLYIFRKLS